VIEKFNEVQTLFSYPRGMRTSLPFAEEAPRLTPLQAALKLAWTFIGWTTAFGSVIVVWMMARA
jgi:hypothetical protein